jgi:hypothetical protein
MGNDHLHGFGFGALCLCLAGCGQIIHGGDDDGPRASELAIAPSPPRTGQTLHCSYSFEGDQDMSTIRWLVDGVEVGTTDTLAGGFAGGDEVTCEVTPGDGLTTGEPVSLTEDVLHGAIAGTVFLDADGDGERGEGEDGIAGRTIYLDDNHNGELDGGEPSTISGDGGGYQFADVLPGSYRVTQVAGDWTQTYPTVGALYEDDFEGDTVDVGRWSVTGDGVSESGGVLILDRNEAADAAFFRPSLGGAGRVALRMRNTRMNWKDMFHGFQIAGACDQARDVSGVSFGFSRYGNFYLAQLRCNGASYEYPAAYAIDQWYDLEAIYDQGQIRILVDGAEVATGQVPMADLGLNLPGPYTDGGDETNTISEIDQVSVELTDLAHTIEIEDGQVADGLDFGTDQ